MKKSSIIIAILAACMFLALIISYFIQVTDKDDYNLLRSTGPITKAELTINHAPAIENKKMLTLSDRKELDSLSLAIDNLGRSVRVDIAKANDVFAIIEVYKRNKKATMKIVNSKYTGWVLIIDNTTFKSDYIFKLVERHCL